jgi:hypothetical protein
MSNARRLKNVQIITHSIIVDITGRVYPTVSPLQRQEGSHDELR